MKALKKLDLNGRVLITFPHYYPGNLGEAVSCSIGTEKVFCERAWDWTLLVYGP